MYSTGILGASAGGRCTLARVTWSAGERARGREELFGMDLGAGEASVFRIKIAHQSLKDSVNPSSKITIRSSTGELGESQ
jgi:ABC-type dipeptide/oligopeptide/nickel transport system ATPase subunit